jgi:hypothetical protein
MFQGRIWNLRPEVTESSGCLSSPVACSFGRSERVPRGVFAEARTLEKGLRVFASRGFKYFESGPHRHDMQQQTDK